LILQGGREFKKKNTSLPSHTKRELGIKTTPSYGAVSLFYRIFFLILYEKMYWSDSDRRGVVSLGWGFGRRASTEGFSMV
jgi:hypothetical protein